MKLARRITLLFLFLSTFISIQLDAQEDNVSSKRAPANKSETKQTKIESAMIVYHNNNPSDVNSRDFTWSLLGFNSESALKNIISKLQSNPYLTKISTIESGEEFNVFIRFTLTDKYEESKIMQAFSAAGVLQKKSLDEGSVVEIIK